MSWRMPVVLLFSLGILSFGLFHCTQAPAPAPLDCKSDANCPRNTTCKEGVCRVSLVEPARWEALAERRGVDSGTIDNSTPETAEQNLENSVDKTTEKVGEAGKTEQVGEAGKTEQLVERVVDGGAVEKGLEKIAEKAVEKVPETKTADVVPKDSSTVEKAPSELIQDR